jgi:hypothetical protein
MGALQENQAEEKDEKEEGLAYGRTLYASTKIEPTIW